MTRIQAIQRAALVLALGLGAAAEADTNKWTQTGTGLTAEVNVLARPVGQHYTFQDWLDSPVVNGSDIQPYQWRTTQILRIQKRKCLQFTGIYLTMPEKGVSGNLHSAVCTTNLTISLSKPLKGGVLTEFDCQRQSTQSGCEVRRASQSRD